MENDDLEIEELTLNNKKKKIKSGSKGKRGERDIVQNLNTRFADILKQNPDNGSFSRSVGSGNRWGQHVHLSKNAKDIYAGDITCPTNFKFVLESKLGYNDIDLCTAFDKGHKQIDTFLKQVSDDAERTDRKPMLLWKKDRKDRLAFVKSGDLDGEYAYFMVYNEWHVVSFEKLLILPDNYFFNV